uniref:Ovule protein n=2 Tax=Schistosoma mansoni TaxID=6183 RepID=A0A3Q0KV43_SCHMA
MLGRRIMGKVEIDGRTSKLRTEMENVCRVNKCIGKQLHNPLTSSKLDNIVVLHDPFSDED